MNTPDYSIGLCKEAIRFLITDDLADGVTRAFSEMGIAEEDETDQDIWREWLRLSEQYANAHRNKGQARDLTDIQLLGFARELAFILLKWIEHNSGQVALREAIQDEED